MWELAIKSQPVRARSVFKTVCPNGLGIGLMYRIFQIRMIGRSSHFKKYAKYSSVNIDDNSRYTFCMLLHCNASPFCIRLYLLNYAAASLIIF